MSESDIAIRVENLSKRYLLGHQANVPKGEATLRDSLVGVARGLLSRTKDMARGSALVAGDSIEEFWALRDVSFEVKRGDVLGVIGSNGAGKSTLLKILSRITEPTSGRITLNGRVSSLLEVGTGFHPELSGRENVFLNGAILGMSRKEIQAKFDEIVDFAEVERFLDTPVKRYSSGMYVRLAFAVAAHLEPEILIVDEVLAVGDVQFQKKCLGKMQSVAGQGRTVLFVSHNLEAVRALCTTGVLLKQGVVDCSGNSMDVANAYLASVRQKVATGSGQWSSDQHTLGVTNVRVMQYGRTTAQISCGDEFKILAEIQLSPECRSLEFGFGFKDDQGNDVIRLNNLHLSQQLEWPSSGEKTVEVTIPGINWIHGTQIFLSTYFGYIAENYQTHEDILSIDLIKSFSKSNSEKIVPHVNKIFIDGIKFS